MKDFVTMKQVFGTEPIPIKIGDLHQVLYEGHPVFMKVIYIYPNGDFEGTVEWEEA